MKRFFVIISLIGPSSLLLLFQLRPELDLFWQAPLFHFYIVTFFTFTALVVATFTAVALGQNGAPRHRLLAAAFAAMGAIFLVHGVTTPEAITFTFNPGIRWGAWLTLTIGGLIFAIASLDRPQRPLAEGLIRWLHRLITLFCLSFVAIVIFAPHWLTVIDNIATPWHQRMIFGLTVALWVWSAGRLAWLWWRTRQRIDGIMALVAAWLAIATVSMHGYELWYLSWWLYHIALLLGSVTAVTILILEYQQLRRFRLTYHYAAIGLIITAALALTASHFFSRTVERQVTSEISTQATRVGRNLALTLICTLPADVTAETLPQAAADNDLFDPPRLDGLNIGAVALLDTQQTPLYQTPAAAPLAFPTTYVQMALSGSSDTYLFESETALFATAESDHYLQTFVPVEMNDQIIAVLSTVQDVPGLVTAVIEARLFGLLLAGLSVGLLYLIMLLVIYRAEQFIIARNDELAHAYADLQAAEALRDDLTGMIIHDLRTPLTSINLSVGLLEKMMPDSGRGQPLLERAQQAAQRMTTLIDQMLDVTRLEDGQIKLTLTAADIGTLLRKKVETFTPEALANHKEITLKQPAEALVVQMDQELISRVLDNLISNAIKYTEPNGHILVQVAPNGASALIQVIDDGEGIPPEEAAHVFDKFYQIKDATGKPRRRGTGLGLSFCKLVVEAHDGRIWVESSPGAGSTFSFTLPLKAPQTKQ